MKISYNWLKEYIEYQEDPQALAVVLTDTGLEVETIEKYETIKGSLAGVVVGKVLTCKKHPDADRLSVTTVDIGNGMVLPIVCGAPNVAVGQKVMVAQTGTTLTTAAGSLEIRKTKIRGEVSEGMICAEDELGVGTSHEGILVLPEEIPVGTPASAYFQLEEDWVFEIGLTPNRIDAASHIGVARDIAAAINQNRQERVLKVNMPQVSGFAPDNLNAPVSVHIEDTEACKRYCGLTMTGLRVTDSPTWLKNRLRAIGQKPINNVVDATNYVLHEMGQPLHAFDLEKIAGNQVVIKKPSSGSVFVSLDQEELTLTGNDLMICNAVDSMCMAGILGGLQSGVTMQTTAIFLESAYFSPQTIRRSSGHHGLKTDASFRFERGADPNMAPVALKRAAMLIKELAGGEISSDVIDQYPAPIQPASVTVSLHRINRLLGNEISLDTVKRILLDLDFVIESENSDQLSLIVPAYRVDVTREADVAEEVLRIYGYNNIGLPQKLHSSIVLSPKPDKEKLQNVVSDMLASRGFLEIMNNSLTKMAYHEAFDYPSDTIVSIVNPLSQDLNVLRQSLVFGGLETIAYNINRKANDLTLFEFGNIYFRLPRQSSSEKAVDSYGERMMLSLFMTGRRNPDTWMAGDEHVDFFDIREAVNSILLRLGVHVNIEKTKIDESARLYTYAQYYETGSRELFRVGLLSGELTSRFDIKQDVYFGLIDWECLTEIASNKSLLYKEVPRHPEVRRDLALLIDESVGFSELEKLAYQAEKELLKEVRLFDVFQDPKLGKGKKSYALSFTLQHPSKTLTEKEIERVVEKLIATYTQKANATVR